MSGKLQIFATNDDDLCSWQDLFSDDRCQTAQKVAATVYDDCLKLKEIFGYVDHKQISFLINV